MIIHKYIYICDANGCIVQVEGSTYTFHHTSQRVPEPVPPHGWTEDYHSGNIYCGLHRVEVAVTDIGSYDANEDKDEDEDTLGPQSWNEKVRDLKTNKEYLSHHA
jgi:hypothetical protein